MDAPSDEEIDDLLPENPLADLRTKLRDRVRKLFKKDNFQRNKWLKLIDKIEDENTLEQKRLIKLSKELKKEETMTGPEEDNNENEENLSSPEAGETEEVREAETEEAETEEAETTSKPSRLKRASRRLANGAIRAPRAIAKGSWKIGKATVKTGIAAGDQIFRKDSASNQAFRNWQQKFKGRSNNTKGIIFLIILLAIHLFDSFVFNFESSPQRILTMVIAYTLIMFYAWEFRYTGEQQKPFSFLMVSLIAIFLPSILPLINYLRKNVSFITLSFYNYFVVAITLTPVWLIYAAFKDGDKYKKAATIYLWILFFLCFIIILGSMSFPNIFQDLFQKSDQINIGGPVKDFFSQVGSSFGSIKLKLTSVFNPEVIKARVNNTLNPYAKYYTGQVEQNSREKLGVYIEDLRSLTPNTYVDEKPIIMAEFVGKSFLDKTVLVTPSCRIQSRDYSAQGTPDPRDSIDLNYQLQRTVTCELPSQSKAGYYDATMGASFNFETWSYITYTFVDLKTIQNYYLQNKDVNTELGIDPYPTAIYTSGPVKIGVSNSRQPIDINTEKTSEEAIKQQFGFTIDSMWQQGNIKRVDSVTVMIPEEFRLSDCKPIPPVEEEDMPEEGMYKYVFNSDSFFNKNNNDFDYRQDLRTVTCKLKLRGQDAMDKIVQFGSKTPATFVVMAKYTYELEQSTRLRIQE